jgi:type VI secretion system protein ImpA
MTITSSTLDIQGLLAPVSSEDPAGPELRNAPTRDAAALFFAVRDARKKAIDAERRLRDFLSMSEDEKKAEPGAPDLPDWDSVRQHAVKALTRSKDLWVTAWLIEAMARLHGFAGLRDGFRLAHQLCDGFWDGIHPRPDNDRDLAERFAQVAGLDGGGTSEGTLIAPILNVPITEPRTIARFSLADYKDAVDLERKPPEIRNRRVEQGAVTMDIFNQAVAETSVEFFTRLRDDLKGADAAVAEFIDSLRERERTHRDSGGSEFIPPSSKIRDVLGECLRLVKGWAKDPLDDSPKETVKTVTATNLDRKPGTSQFPDGLSVETRQEAFQTLLGVADYFRRTEPHSPVSYALEQVVRWGRMPLPDLLAELVSDRSTREDIFKRTGIPQPSTE